MADGSGHPEDLYIEHKLETYNILVIKPDEHLRQFLDILETLGWKPWQVESFVLGEINQSLHDADIMRSANSVRLKITRQVGNSHVKARVRYADGSIAFIVSLHGNHTAEAEIHSAAIRRPTSDLPEL